MRYLNSVGGGKVTRIDGNMAYVDEDGFETPVLLHECVVVTPSTGTSAASSKYIAPSVKGPGSKNTTDATPRQPKTIVPELPDSPKPGEIEETPTGDKLNIVLAYEPDEIKQLSTTTYDAYLVNDSNYYLYFTYLTRGSDTQWLTKYAGIVEPNMQVHLGEVDYESLNSMDRIALQYVAFKRDREFALKSPAAVEYSLDTTKFFKLHCFHESIYFGTPVIEIPLVKNDIPQRPMTIDSGELERAMRQKRHADQPAHRPIVKHKPSGPIEVDLHIHQLLDTTAGLSNSDMLEVQLKEFRRVMDENLRHKGQKIVFIHGKGEGVLRAALLKELKRHYPECTTQDASFKEYGFGATQVTIK